MDNYSYDDYEYVDGVKRQMEKDSSANEIITPTYNIKDDIQDDMHDEIHDDIRDIKEEHQRYFDESDMSHLLDYPEPGNSIDNLVYMRNEVTNLYHCDQCPLEFKLLRNLRRHLLTHSDNRPFNCEFCEKTFKRKDNLQKHLRDIHSEKHFSCKACDKGFATYGQLQRHQLTQRHRKNR
ncbi:histone-lysine N-methyltransferase MECOM [Stomoxys calcitrans]|nr:histone-lysine N-methyltransferase MECOM [Stomoxys calcitrans]